MTQSVVPHAHQHRRLQRLRWLKALAIIGVVGLTVTGTPLMAEEEQFVLDLFRPRLDIGAEAISRRAFTDDEDVAARSF
jgi:hypothetical protein